jgi:hypothetical protein
VASYSDTDTISTTRIDVFDRAHGEWKEYAGTAILSDLEADRNAGEGTVYPLLPAKLENLPINERIMASILLFGRWAETDPLAAMAYSDKMGMAAGVEVRVPLLDLDLMDLACSLPLDMKQRGRVGKWIFKKAMEPFLPHDVIYRPKTGFGVPLRQWLQTILKPLVDDVLSDASLRSRGVFSPVAVQQLRRADLAGRVDATYTIFSMVCLELWCRQYMDGAYALDATL